MRYFIVDTDSSTAEMIAANLTRFFVAKNLEGHQVEAYPMSLEQWVSQGSKADVIITPDNGYGDMTGGFDQALVNVLGPRIQEYVHTFIRTRYLGEMNVGQAMFIPLGMPNDPFGAVVYAPTMRLPRALRPDSDVPYMSLLAAFQAIAANAPETQSIVLTSHGRGYGQLSRAAVAHQTMLAVERFHLHFHSPRLYLMP